MHRFFLLPALLAAVACGSSSPLTAFERTTPPPTDAGPEPLVSGDAGAPVFAPDTAAVTVTAAGGMPGPAPDGSACSTPGTTYVLVVPHGQLSAQLSWTAYDVPCGGLPDGGTSDTVTGSRVLSGAEYAPLSAALGALALSTTIQCGADKPEETIKVTRPSSETTYYDDFYECSHDGRAYVSGLDDVLTELDKLRAAKN